MQAKFMYEWTKNQGSKMNACLNLKNTDGAKGPVGSKGNCKNDKDVLALDSRGGGAALPHGVHEDLKAKQSEDQRKAQLMSLWNQMSGAWPSLEYPSSSDHRPNLTRISLNLRFISPTQATGCTSLIASGTSSWPPSTRQGHT